MGVSVVPTTRVLMPRNGKQYPAVAGVGHHDGRVAAQELTLEDQVNALAGRDHACQIRLSQPAHIVGENACRIHHHMRRELHRGRIHCQPRRLRWRSRRRRG